MRYTTSYLELAYEEEVPGVRLVDWDWNPHYQLSIYRLHRGKIGKDCFHGPQELLAVKCTCWWCFNMIKWYVTHESVDFERSGARWFPRYNMARNPLNTSYRLSSWARSGHAHFHSVVVF